MRCEDHVGVCERRMRDSRHRICDCYEAGAMASGNSRSQPRHKSHVATPGLLSTTPLGERAPLLAVVSVGMPSGDRGGKYAPPTIGKPRSTFLQQLDTDTLHRVTSFLDPVSVAKLRASCRAGREVGTEPSAWLWLLDCTFRPPAAVIAKVSKEHARTTVLVGASGRSSTLPPSHPFRVFAQMCVAQWCLRIRVVGTRLRRFPDRSPHLRRVSRVAWEQVG